MKTRGVHQPDFSHLIFSQTRLSMLFATGQLFRGIAGVMFIALFTSFFPPHVSQIFGLRSEKQMAGVAAGWVVSGGAIVTGIQFYRPLASSDKPGDDVSVVLPTLDNEPAITSGTFASLPEPTFNRITDVDIGPKFSNVGLCKYGCGRIGVSHDANLFTGWLWLEPASVLQHALARTIIPRLLVEDNDRV